MIETIQKSEERKKKETKESENKRNKKNVPLESQIRLAEILNDSPHLVSLNGTEWEVRALRVGTQWLIAEKVCEMCKTEGQTFGDVLKEFSTTIPTIVEILALALLNDKKKIFKGGEQEKGYSDLYRMTLDTLRWECNVNDYGMLLMEVFKMIDVDFFFQAKGILAAFKAMTTERKRMRTRTEEPR